MLINAFVIVFFVSFCSGFELDKSLQLSENENFLNCFFNNLNISDIIEPAVSHKGSSNKTNFAAPINQCAETINDSIDLDYIKNVSPKVLEIQPPFDFSGHKVSAKCRRSSKEFISSLENFELWALRSKFYR